MNILGINISHDPSICLVQDGIVKKYYDECRIKKHKTWSPMINHCMYDSISLIKEPIDIVCYSSYGRNNNDDSKIINVINNQMENPPFFFNVNNHHLYHAVTGFYFSEFDDAHVIVLDGGGATPFYPDHQEQESIYHLNNENCNLLYCRLSDSRVRTREFREINTRKFEIIDGAEIIFMHSMGAGQTYNHMCALTGFIDGRNAGKLMGLSCYGENDPRFNNLLLKYAKLAQEYLYETTCELIEKCINQYNAKNIIISGGCALNCLNNYKYVVKYKEINFFIDPVPHDGGTAIGAALYYNNYLNN